MTPEMLAACMAAVDAKVTKPCPHCGHADRSIVEELSNLPLSRAHVTGLLTHYVPAIPVVLLMCKGCGFIAAFSAYALGVLQHEEPPKPTAKRAKRPAKPAAKAPRRRR